MKARLLAWGLIGSILGLWIQIGTAQVTPEFLPRYLEMLGYSQGEIGELLAGTAGLKALDEVFQLEAMGYSPEEIDQIVRGKRPRRQVDAAFGQKAIAAAGRKEPANRETPDDGPENRKPGSGEEPAGAIPPGLEAHFAWPGGQAWGAGYGDLTRARAQAQPYWQMVGTTAQRFAVDPALILAVIAAESDFQPRAVSAKGALGLMQLMPHTAEMFGVAFGDLFNPGINIRAGTQFLAECLETFGSERLALAAYNAGPSRVSLHEGIPPIVETRRYVAKVLRLRQGYRTLLRQYPIHGL